MVLAVFQEDAFLDIEEQCNQVWFDLVDGMNMVPKEVDYKDEIKELTDAMPTIETFEVFHDGLLLDLEREMEHCMQESIWDSVLRDTTNSPLYQWTQGWNSLLFKPRGVEIYIDL